MPPAVGYARRKGGIGWSWYSGIIIEGQRARGDGTDHGPTFGSSAAGLLIKTRALSTAAHGLVVAARRGLPKSRITRGLRTKSDKLSGRPAGSVFKTARKGERKICRSGYPVHISYFPEGLRSGSGCSLSEVGSGAANRAGDPGCIRTVSPTRSRGAYLMDGVRMGGRPN